MSIFWTFTKQAFLKSSAYRFEFWVQIFQVYLLMYSIYWLWNKLFQQSPTMFDINLEQIVTYGILGMILDAIYFHMDGPNVYIANQVRTGKIEGDLLKPINFHFYIFSLVFGETAFKLVTLIFPCYVVAVIFLNLSLPNDTITILYFVISALLGFLINFSLNFLLGLIAFITLNLSGIEWTYYAIMRFLGGQLIPLWFFPEIISAIADKLPFKGIYYTPISIYIGKITGGALVESLMHQVIWLVALVLIGIFSWKIIHKRLAVQGG